jgi:hypothetical protein
VAEPFIAIRNVRVRNQLQQCERLFATSPLDTEVKGRRPIAKVGDLGKNFGICRKLWLFRP